MAKINNQDITNLQDVANKITAYFEAIEKLLEHMIGYDAYPVKALCVCGSEELTTLESIITRINDDEK